MEVVVVVVPGRRHLVVVVVAAPLLQSPASSAGGRHLTHTHTPVYLPGGTQDDYSCSHVQRKSCELRETDWWYRVLGSARRLIWVGGGSGGDTLEIPGGGLLSTTDTRLKTNLV